MDTLQKRIRFALGLLKNNPADLAKYTGISKTVVSQWVNGSVETISFTYLLKVANFLRVSPQWLASGEGSPFKIKQNHTNNNLVSEDEQEWLDLIRLLNNKQQKALYMSMTVMVNNETKKMLN